MNPGPLTPFFNHLAVASCVRYGDAKGESFMIRRKIYTQQMLARVVDFAATHVDLFPKDSIAGEVLATLSGHVSKLFTHASEQVSGDGQVRTSSVSRLDARNALEVQLQLIEQVAQALNLSNFFLPRRRSEAAFIAAGEAFARDAEPLKEQFIKQGLPPAFIENLKTAVENLRRAMLDGS